MFEMNRRKFIKTAGVMAGTIPCLSPASAVSRSAEAYDNYGGWRGRRFEPTGFFRIEKDERWWFVTPEGNAFLSFGINHYHAGWWSQDYNRKHWMENFGASEVLDRKWKKGFKEAAHSDLMRLGINTLGWHTDTVLITGRPYGSFVPYLRSYKPIVLDHYRHPEEEAFVDVFADDFQKLCERTAREVATPYVDDPMLLGYCMSDCPVFTDIDIQSTGGSTSWSRILRNLGSNASGKRAYVSMMKKRYAKIEAFNKVYRTSFSTWDDLTKSKNWRPNVGPNSEEERADNEAFTLLCVDRYYSVAESALRRVDSNHMFFGDKLNGNTDNLEKTLDVAAKYVDVIVYQFYGTPEEHKLLLDSVTARVALPVLNGDTGFSSPSEMMPNPYGPHASDQDQRAEWLVEAANACFARPEFIGLHMCGIIDTWKTMPGKEMNQHQGLMTVTGKFYPEMEEAVKRISSSLYRRNTIE